MSERSTDLQSQTEPQSQTELSWHAELTAEQTTRLREFLQAVQDADGRPLVEPTGPLPHELRTAEQLFAVRAGELVGYAHLDTAGDAFGRQVAELYVHPAHRRRGAGSEVTAEVVRGAGIAQGTGDRLRLWSHGDHPAAARIAERQGFARVRELHRMRMDLPRADLTPPSLPGDIRVRTFEPGSDEAALIECNRRAFGWHPEQAALSMADLMREENEDWFDAAGFFVAERAGRAGLVGFHWTKVHQRVVADDSGLPVGEVYVVGVDPDAQGTGLGTALTVAGLDYLRRQGLRQAMLYVESDNAAAIHVYERLGFHIWDTDVQYAR